MYSRSEDVNGSAIDAYLLPDAQLFVEVTLDASLALVGEVASVFLGDRLVARVKDGVLNHVVSDQISFPFAVADDQANVVWHADADPFGQILSLYTGTSSNDPLRRYPGQWTLPNALGSDSLDLLYNTYRWYLLGWGRYTQSDPVLPSLAFSPRIPPSHSHELAYAAGNPLSYVDSLGLRVDPGELGAEYNQFKRCFPLFRSMASHYESASQRYVIKRGNTFGRGCTLTPGTLVFSWTEIPIVVDFEKKSCEEILKCLTHEMYEWYLVWY